MKTYFKLHTVLLFVLGIVFSLSFMPEKKDYKDFYIYVYTHDKADYNNIYVSAPIHYKYEACGNTYDWQPKVERTFKNYLKSEHSIDHDYVYIIGSTTNNYLDSREKAEESFYEWSAGMANKGHSVTKTLFDYNCN